MAIESHPSFSMPLVSTPLWRYIDLPKFVSLLITQKIWLSSAEVLALDDPHEASLSTTQFGHRSWQSLDDVPRDTRNHILREFGPRDHQWPLSAFRSYMRQQESIHLYCQFWRRYYFVNCWHAASHESVAMWKIYASPGPGLAVISNGARLSEAFSNCEEPLYLGEVKYFDESREQLDLSNFFNAVLAKRQSFAFEKEVRLVHAEGGHRHDPADFESWNDETMRFDTLVPDQRPMIPGIAITCDLTTLIDHIVISPYAPSWYLDTIRSLRDRLGFQFEIKVSQLMTPPQTAT